MIEKQIIEWLDLGDSVVKLQLYESPILIGFFELQRLKQKIVQIPKTLYIILNIIFFLQLFLLSLENVDYKDDTILEVFHYFENVIFLHKLISTKNIYIIFTIIFSIIFVLHFLSFIFYLFLKTRKNAINFFILCLKYLDLIIYYYLLIPTIYIAFEGFNCEEENSILKHKLLDVSCYETKHLIFLILNIIYALAFLCYSIITSLFFYRIGHIKRANITSKINCSYDLYSTVVKIILFALSFIYMKLFEDSKIFKHIYYLVIIIFNCIMAIYASRTVYYYDNHINYLIHYGWFINTWFSLCVYLKKILNIKEITLFVILGSVIIIFIFKYHVSVSNFQLLNQINIFNENNFIKIQQFVSMIIQLFKNQDRQNQVLLCGVIKKYEDYIQSNPEICEIYTRTIQDEHLRKRFTSFNQLETLALIFSIYSHYYDQFDDDNKIEIAVCMCYFLVSKLKNITLSFNILSKLQMTNKIKFYQVYVLIELIKDYLFEKLNNKRHKENIRHAEFGSVMLYHQYHDLMKMKIYDAACNQIDYFDILRNSSTSKNMAKNFLNIGNNIIKLYKEIFQLWRKLMEFNPFSDEIIKDFSLYLDIILQNEEKANKEKKKFSNLRINKLPEKNNIHYRMFNQEDSSIVLVDGYSRNGKIIYVAPNFPNLFYYNEKEALSATMEDVQPNCVQFFHKYIVENATNYSNVSFVYKKDVNAYIKGKTGNLFDINAFLKPLPNLTYGLIFILYVEKNEERDFVILLDKDLIIDSFTEMNLGNGIDFSMGNIYGITQNVSKHNIGIILPEILLNVTYKNNYFQFPKQNMDIKGNLYLLENMKELDTYVNNLLTIIKKQGSLISNENEKNKNMDDYISFVKELDRRKIKVYSVFFRIVTRLMVARRFRYHRIYVINDILSENEMNNIKVSDSDNNNNELYLNKKVRRSIISNKLNEIKNMSINNSVTSNITDTKKVIKLNVNNIKKETKINNENEDNNEKNDQENINEIQNQNINPTNKSANSQVNNDISIIRTVTFNKLRENIISNKTPRFIFIIITCCLIFVLLAMYILFYEKKYLYDFYMDLLEYLFEDLLFTRTKIDSVGIYISSLNIKLLRYKFLNESSCYMKCTSYNAGILKKCADDIVSSKENITKFHNDFKEILNTNNTLNLKVFGFDRDQSIFDVNDYLNYLVVTSIKLIGIVNNYTIGNNGFYDVLVDNLIEQALNYSQSTEINGFSEEFEEERTRKLFNIKFDKIVIVICICIVFAAIFVYLISIYNTLEIFFVDKLINFNSTNFDNYLKLIDELKNSLKNDTGNEEEDNNKDDIDNENAGSNLNNEENHSINENLKKSTKKNKSSNFLNNIKLNSKKKKNKQNKLQLQKIKKLKMFSSFFYKENFLFLAKLLSIGLIYLSYFILALFLSQMYKADITEFNESFHDIQEIYFSCFKIYLLFKTELEKLVNAKINNESYAMQVPDNNDINKPNFGNILTDISLNKIYNKKNLEEFNELYFNSVCNAITNYGNYTNNNYQSQLKKKCQNFWSSILNKGLEQSVAQMGVIINSIITEFDFVNLHNEDLETNLLSNTSSFYTYETFVQYYLLFAFYMNNKYYEKFKSDVSEYVKGKVSTISNLFAVVYVLVAIPMFLLLISYSSLLNSFLNFLFILPTKYIVEDEKLRNKILEIQKSLYMD